MVSVAIILVAIIVVIIVAIIIAGFFYLNRERPPVALITNFGLTIRTPGQLYMSIENVNEGVFPGPPEIFPIMTLKSLDSNRPPEPSDGWFLQRPSNNPTGNIVTFFNPSNSGYINYRVDGNGNIIGGYIRADGITKPPDPTEGNPASFLGWFALEQNAVDNTTRFRSLFPGPIKNQAQYLIIGNSSVLPNNPAVLPITIGIPSNNNDIWIVA